MEINFPVITSAGSDEVSSYHEPVNDTPRYPQWLLELDVDGTIRHSSSHPAAAVENGNSLEGSNFFDLGALLGDLSDLKRDFVGFVRGDKNRETAWLRGSREAMIVLTRSFDTSWPSRRPIVLMEIRSE
jgi:hypothetical protein